jgi:hypothetical protein
VFVKPQLDDIRRVLGDHNAAFCLGIKRVQLDFEEQNGSTLRAIQFLHLFMFPPSRKVVRLVDILTSFRYALPAEVDNPPEDWAI